MPCDLACYWDKHRHQYRYNTHENQIDCSLTKYQGIEMLQLKFKLKNMNER
jgi:hypothetical protein